MTFPTAGSSVYYNEEGEVLGWDNDQYYEPPEPDDFGPDYYDYGDYDEEDDDG